MKVGEVIRYYREREGYSQKELAQKVHMSVRTIGHYETGTRSPSIEVMEQLAKALLIHVSDFFLPIKQEKFVYYDNVWIYHYDEEKEEHILRDDTYAEMYKETVCYIVRIGKDVIYVPSCMIYEAIQEEGARKRTYCTIDGEKIPIVEILKTKEERFLIIKVGKEKKECALVVDAVLEVGGYGVSTCKEINEKTKIKQEKEEEWGRLRFDSLQFKIHAAMMQVEELDIFGEHLYEYSWILEKNCSPVIKQAKIHELLHSLERIPKETFDETMSAYL